MKFLWYQVTIKDCDVFSCVSNLNFGRSDDNSLFYNRHMRLEEKCERREFIELIDIKVSDYRVLLFKLLKSFVSISGCTSGIFNCLLKFLQIVNPISKYHVFFKWENIKKSRGVNSGDQFGHNPTHQSARKNSFKWLLFMPCKQQLNLVRNSR